MVRLKLVALYVNNFVLRPFLRIPYNLTEKWNLYRY